MDLSMMRTSYKVTQQKLKYEMSKINNIIKFKTIRSELAA